MARHSLGKSSSSNTTKIHIAVEAHGLPIDFEITGGEVNDCKIAPAFIEKPPVADFTVADKGYDSEDVREVNLIIDGELDLIVTPRGNVTLENGCLSR